MTDYNTSDKIIDVEYDEVENVIYLSAPQLAKKIGTTEATIRTWADEDVYGDLIGIEKVNGRKTYKETQVEKFAFIKDLVENKNMKKSQVRNYISKHGFKYAEYDSGLLDPKDPLGFQALASALTVEVNSKLNQFSEELMTQVTNQLSEYLEIQKQMNLETKAEIESAVDEIVTEKLDTNLTNIKTHINESTEKSIKIQQENKNKLDEVSEVVTTLKEENDEIKELLKDAVNKQRKSRERKLGGFINKILGKD